MGTLSTLWLWIRHLLAFARRVLGAFLRNRGILLAGGVGYNALLSLVPILTLTVTVLSYVFDEDHILEVLRPELRMIVPRHADVILQTVKAFLANQAAAGAVSVLLLLFFSSIAFRMLEEAVDAIFHHHAEGARRSFWVSALMPYVFMALLMAGLFFVTLLTSGLDALAERSIRLLGVELSLTYGVNLLLRLLGFAGLVGLISGIYHVLPVAKISMRRALIGGLFAASLWRLVGRFMVYYFASLSKVDLIYGSLATVIVVLLFLEVAFTILLLGAQVIAELETSAAAGVRWYEKPGGPIGAD